MLPVQNSEAEAGGAPSVRGQPGPHSELQASLDCIVRPVLKDKILLHGYLGGHPFAVWRARRRWLQPGGLSVRLPAQGGEQAEEGGAAGLGPGLQLRRKCPPARTSSAENAPARRPDLELAAPQPQPRSPAGERLASPAACNARGRCSRLLLLLLALASSSTPSPPSLSLPPSLSSSGLSSPLLISPSSLPGKPCKWSPSPRAPGRQPQAAVAGFLGCSLPGWNYRATFVLF